MSDLHLLSATALRDGMDKGHFSAADIARDILARIKEREPLIHAWQFMSASKVMDQANGQDSPGAAGILRGIPVGIKDIMDTHDMPTEYGAAIYRGNQPGADASVVATLRDAGANIIGKTVTTELAYFRPGPTVNPVDPACTPGGSSSGSAAAVADFMVPVAFGSQTAGSLTRPASYCGIVGYKPTYGLHSLVGVKQLSHSLDTLGWMTRTVEDAALVRAAMLGIEYEDLEQGILDPPRIGLCRTPEWPAADRDTRDALEYAARQLSADGAQVVEVALPETFAGLVEAQKTIMAFEVAQSLAWEWSNHRDQLSAPLAALLQQGTACAPDSYIAAQTLAREGRVRIERIFDNYDALLVPSATGEAPERHSGTGDPIFSRLWALLHLPSITLPGFLGSHGRPVGVQLVGKVFDDERLLRIAHWCHGRLVK